VTPIRSCVRTTRNGHERKCFVDLDRSAVDGRACALGDRRVAHICATLGRERKLYCSKKDDILEAVDCDVVDTLG